MFPPCPDPELIEKNRQLVLGSLELIFMLDERRRKEIEGLQEECAAEEWLSSRLKAELPPDVLRAVLIDFRVNHMDSDFSFYRAIHNRPPVPVRPLNLVSAE